MAPINRFELQLEKAVADLRLFAKEEADKARDKAVNSFRNVGLVISLLLTIIGYLGISQLAGNAVDAFIKEKGVASSLENLSQAEDSASNTLKSIGKEYEKAKSIASVIASLNPSLPHVVAFLETSVPANYDEVESEWRYFPYQDNKAMEIPISVGSKADLFLVAFNYRSIGSQDGFKSSRISVTANGNSIKSVTAMGGAFRTNQFDASGSVVLTNLNKGQFLIRLEDFDSQKAHKKYEPGRQLIVYRLR